MRDFILSIPTAFMLLIIVGGSSLVTVALTYYVRIHIDEELHEANNEVAGFIFSAVGVIYGVLLAFMVLVVWQSYQDAQLTVENEANTLVRVYRLGQEMPEPYGSQIRSLAETYANQVVNQEWDAMKRGESSADVSETIEKLYIVHRELHTANADSEERESKLFDSIDDLGNQRRIRLLDSRNDLPPLLWWLLILGAVATLGFTLFLRAPNWKAHLLMAGVFAGLVAFVLLLIIELDSPFAGEIKIAPLAFQQALSTFARLKGN